MINVWHVKKTGKLAVRNNWFNHFLPDFGVLSKVEKIKKSEMVDQDSLRLEIMTYFALMWRHHLNDLIENIFGFMYP